MAQVYSFVDDNGVTRLLAEISPDPAFNGGTVTGLTTYQPATADQSALIIRPPAGATDDDTSEIAVYDDTGDVKRVNITADGEIFVTGSVAVTLAARQSNGTWTYTGISQTIYDGTSGNAILTVGGGGVSVVAGNPRAETYAFGVQTSDNATPFLVRDDHGVVLTGLPTSDPGHTGQIYSVAGVLHVSP